MTLVVFNISLSACYIFTGTYYWFIDFIHEKCNQGATIIKMKIQDRLLVSQFVCPSVFLSSNNQLFLLWLLLLLFTAEVVFNYDFVEYYAFPLKISFLWSTQLPTTTFAPKVKQFNTSFYISMLFYYFFFLILNFSIFGIFFICRTTDCQARRRRSHKKQSICCTNTVNGNSHLCWLSATELKFIAHFYSYI